MATPQSHYTVPADAATSVGRVGVPPNTFSLALTDTSMAEQFAAQAGDRFRYDPIDKLWRMYDRVAWRPDHRGVSVEVVKAIVSDMVDTALERDDRDGARAAIRWHSVRNVKAALTLAQSIPGLPKLPHEFDSDPLLFNCLSHTIDLRTRLPRDHDAGDLITKVAPVRYDPDARCEGWMAFLDRVFAGDGELAGAVQRIVGASLAGVIRENVFLVFWGAGSNGKSTFVNVVQQLLGDYAAAVKSDAFLDRHLDPQGFLLADLPGVRLVTAAETGREGKLNEALVKAMTGRDRIRVAHKYGHPFEFTPVFKPVLITNHKPTIEGQDHAIWRRVKLIPFEVTIPDAEQDLEMADKLMAELPGILNWALDGCAAWLTGGLAFPEAVLRATEAYRAEQDQLADWIEEHCVVGPQYEDDFSALYADYGTWCREHEDQPLSKTKFALTLTERGCVLVKHGKRRSRWRRGIARAARAALEVDGHAAGRTGFEARQIWADGFEAIPAKVITRERVDDVCENEAKPVLPVRHTPDRAEVERRVEEALDEVYGAGDPPREEAVQ